MAVKRILLTGGSGRLGRVLLKHLQFHADVFAPRREALNIYDRDECQSACECWDPDIIIHAAGYANAYEAEQDGWKLAWLGNVEGTRNMVRAAAGRRLVHISTDYVFGGDWGNYGETNMPAPVNRYGFTKAIAEAVVQEHPNTLILRAPFRSDPPWPFARAFVDQWTSCDFVSVRAPQIAQAALSDVLGILHIGGPRRSIFELAQMASPDVKQMSRLDAGVPLPKDTSLDCSRWQALQEEWKRQETYDHAIQS